MTASDRGGCEVTAPDRGGREVKLSPCNAGGDHAKVLIWVVANITNATYDVRATRVRGDEVV